MLKYHKNIINVMLLKLINRLPPTGSDSSTLIMVRFGFIL